MGMTHLRGSRGENCTSERLEVFKAARSPILPSLEVPDSQARIVAIRRN